ncbi:hypothetical protein [Ligilactobacillus ceti]|uniref:Uncharacterized protein n=1 Tax=Ligilactobacillus ceti DSM 22408 TaxID=1122146 RepID=A0A0R2KH22_9LACO|nr:hypothetical protein [Ligilactobacillus ceti]KRN88691.1 hypothetical protein IV53_GL000657 [Ligilactobacillus ceti DSM 22408]
MKVIQTEYKGYLFRSRLEARWAVFFDSVGVDWEYEVEGFELEDGSKYLPDFLIHGVKGCYEGDLYVEVKGYLSKSDANKIRLFAKEHPILIVSRIPYGSDISYITENTSNMSRKSVHGIVPFNFKFIDGRNAPAHMGLNKKGGFELFQNGSFFLEERNDESTEKAYRNARQARFEFGESPKLVGVR